MEGTSTAYPPPYGKPSVYQQQPPPPAYYPAPQQFNSSGAPPISYGTATPIQYSGQQPVILVQSQPTAPVIVVRRTLGDRFLTLSIVMTVFAFVFCNWLSLFCTIPAIVFAVMAKDADSRGDYEKARTHGYISLGFNLAAIIAYVIFVILIVVSVTQINSVSNCYYDTYDSYYYCY